MIEHTLPHNKRFEMAKLVLKREVSFPRRIEYFWWTGQEYVKKDRHAKGIVKLEESEDWNKGANVFLDLSNGRIYHD